MATILYRRSFIADSSGPRSHTKAWDLIEKMK